MAILVQKKKKIVEGADIETFQSGEEEKVKRLLLKLLINKDGTFGKFHYPKYAARFNDFDFEIVPSKDDPKRHIKGDPNFTAAISFDEGKVYISDGFLAKGPDGGLDKSTFEQLPVLLRHELAHNLLMHEVRMMHKLGDSRYKQKLKNSGTLQDLLNIIMDFEISNRKYTSSDKKIARSMWLNGREIKGLVTEFHRKDWAELSVEEMYDKLTEELTRLNEKILTNRKYSDTDAFYGFPKEVDSVESAINGALKQYADVKTPSFIHPTYKQFIQKDAFTKHWAKEYQKYLIENFELLEALKLSPDVLNVILLNLANTKFLEPFDLVNPLTGEIIIKDIATTEEKYIIANILKYLAGNIRPRTKVHVKKEEHSKEYKDMYNSVIKIFGGRGKYTAEQIAEILNKVMAGGASIDLDHTIR